MAQMDTLVDSVKPLSFFLKGLTPVLHNLFQKMLLLLLSHFNHFQLLMTPWTAAYQALPSLGFSRQEHWSGLPLPSPMHEMEKGK